MKGRVAALFLVAALCVGGIAYSATSPNGLPRGDAVFGGGSFTFFAGHHFSLTASGGTGTLQYGRFRLEVTCMQVAGNAAVVGGILRETPDGSGTGGLAFMHFVDNGPSSGPTVGGDTVSPLNLVGPGEDGGGLPKVCPPVDATQAAYALEAGDILVNAKS